MKYNISISENAKWSGNLVMDIPNLEVMPSCNGTLVNINYAISIHLKARAAKQLVLELPFVLRFLIFHFVFTLQFFSSRSNAVS